MYRYLHLGRALRLASTATRGLSNSSNALERVAESLGRSVRVKVCSRFAKNNILLRPWFLRYIPEGGYELDIDYIDTKPDADPEDPSVKTIVVLHGTPGSYYDFLKFLVTFGAEYRIIVPNFPNFSHTLKTGCFWHSAEEKSEFIVDFLKHIKVNRVDCLLAHSMAAYTASYLWIYANWDNYFKLGSVCLLCPIGMYKLSRKEKIRLSLLTNMCRSLFLQQLIPKRLAYSKNQMPLSGSLSANLEIAAWKALTIYLSNYSNYHLRLRVLESMKIPTLFMFTSNDKLYVPNLYYDQLFELGASADNYDVYEQYDNELIQSANDQSWLKVVDFRQGGHYMFNTHPFIVHSYMGELLARSWQEYKLIGDSNKEQQSDTT